MKKVYFHDSRGGVQLLGINEDAWALISNFLKEHNYTAHYVREWDEDGKHWYDVGSHTEFFSATEA